MLQFGSFPMWELISCRKLSSVPLVVWCEFVCDCWSYPLTPLWLTPVWMSPVYSLNKIWVDIVPLHILDFETKDCHVPVITKLGFLQMYKQKIINAIIMVSSFCLFSPYLSFTFSWQHLFWKLILTYHTHIYLDGSALKAMSARGLSRRPLFSFKRHRVIRLGWEKTFYPLPFSAGLSVNLLFYGTLSFKLDFLPRN